MTTMNNGCPAGPSVHEQHQAPMPRPFCGHVGLAFGGGSKFVKIVPCVPAQER